MYGKDSKQNDVSQHSSIMLDLLLASSWGGGIVAPNNLLTKPHHRRKNDKASLYHIQKAIEQGKATLCYAAGSHRERESNKFKFIVLRDGTNIIQCVVRKRIS